MRLGKIACCLGEPLSIRIPGSVREIGDEVDLFYHQRLLADLSFEEGIVKIGVSAFRECPGLKKAAFPASLMSNNHQRVLSSPEAVRPNNPASQSASYSRAKPEGLEDDPND
jgi:hypothetical protein